MRRIFYCFALIIIVFCASQNSLGQDRAEARYRKGKMIEISDLLSSEEREDCTARRYVGAVSAIQLKNGKQIDSFMLKTKRGNLKIYLSPFLYSERLSKKHAASLPTLIARGKTITVNTYICGASGKIILALYILAGSEPDTLG